MEKKVFREYIYHTSPEMLWNAITVKEKMKLWYFDLEEFKPEVGFEFRFWGGTEKRQYLHICKITEVSPGQKLCHTWSYDGIPGLTNLCFEIVPINDVGGRLLVREEHKPPIQSCFWRPLSCLPFTFPLKRRTTRSARF